MNQNHSYADGFVPDPSYENLAQIVVAFSSRLEKSASAFGDVLSVNERALYNRAIEILTRAATPRDEIAARRRAARKIWELGTQEEITEALVARVLEEEGLR